MLLSALFTCALGVAAELGVDPPAPRGPSPVARPRREVMELAGSGSNVPLTRALAEAWRASGGGAARVHESVGSGGGLRALRDGAVDVALVSRPLRPDEARGLRVARYAVTEVVLAANAGIGAERLTRTELVEVLRGERRRWRDGSALSFIAREAGDSSHRALAEAVPGFAEAERNALRERRFRVVYSDDDLRDALVETPGGLGVTDRGGVAMHGRVLAQVPLLPSAPITKDLAFVYAPDARPEVHAFVAFALSEAGRGVVRLRGYAPPEGP